jgi:soluble lytic murein transglycosylase-like protein
VIIACVVVLELLALSAGWLIGMAPSREVAITQEPAPEAFVRKPARSPVLQPAVFLPLPFPVFPAMPELSAPFHAAAHDPNDYEPLIHEAAFRHALPPQLLLAVARVESDFQPFEVSPKGARGLMQVMPETGVRFGVRPEELFDPERNIAAGTAYLAWLLDRYNGDLDLTLAAYNAGEGAVDKYGGIPPYRETQEYVRRVRNVLNEVRR